MGNYALQACVCCCGCLPGALLSSGKQTQMSYDPSPGESYSFVKEMDSKPRSCKRVWKARNPQDTLGTSRRIKGAGLLAGDVRAGFPQVDQRGI